MGSDRQARVVGKTFTYSRVLSYILLIYLLVYLTERSFILSFISPLSISILSVGLSWIVESFIFSTTFVPTSQSFPSSENSRSHLEHARIEHFSMLLSSIIPTTWLTPFGECQNFPPAQLLSADRLTTQRDLRSSASCRAL